MQVERTNKDFQVFINDNDDWQPLAKANTVDIESCWDYPSDFSYEFPIKTASNYEINLYNILDAKKLDFDTEYDLKIDDVKLRGKLYIEWLWVKWYNKKKGKKYKKYCKHSKEFILSFKGKVIE